MAPKWLWNGKDDIEKKPDDEIEIKPPKEIMEKFEKLDSLETSFNEFKEKSKVLDRFSSFLDEQEEAKKVARAKEAEARAKVATEESEETWLTDPKKAATDMLQPLVREQLKTASRLLRNELFSDGTQYEYYHGDFKKKVDQYIDTLPIGSMNNTDSLRNCYNVVLGESMKEIQDGKLKSRFAATSTAAAKSGEGKSGDSKTITLTDEQKKAAERLGIKTEDYSKYVGEYV
jgi:hypothetical protein